MNRRSLLSLVAASLTAGSLSRIATAAPAAGRNLVIFYSRADENYDVGYVKTGNTAIMARIVADTVGADIFEVRPVNAYPAAYTPCTEQAKAEQRRNARPAFVDENVPDIASYDNIYIGFPVWWGDLPMTLYTFLEKYSIAGKNVIPFCTHEGSGFSRTLSGLRRVGKNIKLQEGLDMTGSRCQNDADGVRREVKAWLGA